METTTLYEGGCHCGQVRFRVRVREHEALECSRSVCVKKIAKHRFCKSCGVHPFYTPRSHPDRIDVNVRCLEGVLPAAFSITAFDGKNWEAGFRSLQQA